MVPSGSQAGSRAEPQAAPQPSGGDPDGRDGIRRYLTLGIVVIVCLVGGLGSWAALASLHGAVIAFGSIVVEGSSKRVQHPEGGVVSQILVRDGDHVVAGELVARLDDTVIAANLMIVEQQLIELTARRARLEAERDGRADLEVLPALSPGNEGAVARAFAGEQTLLRTRRAGRAGQIAQLRERIAQLKEESQGLAAQIGAKDQELTLIESELRDLAGLYEKKLVPATRLTALRREKARLEGERGQLQANLASTRGRVSEIKLQIIQIDQDMQTEVIEELREVEAKLAELRERKVAALDRQTRVDIRAPRDGVVHQLAVHTVGGVIGPAETIMMIVPDDETLVVEARVAPTDVDQVSPGQQAVLQLSAFNRRTTPEITGAVAHVSPDLTQDQSTGELYYVARIELSAEERERLGDLMLIPGMPVEAFIRTEERTPLSYIIQPLRDHVDRALREE